MKRMLSILILFLAAGTFYVNANPLPNGFCPVMPGHAVKQKFYADYEGQRIFLCCRSCVKAFQKHPERYLKNLNQPEALSARH